MKKNVKNLIEKAENLGWKVDKFDGGYEFAKHSPADQDFNFAIHTENNRHDFIKAIYERYENFDCSEEASYWLDDTGHGTNGAPHDMRDLYNDMEACENMIKDLYLRLMEV